jgi:hypothetical protein
MITAVIILIVIFAAFLIIPISISLFFFQRRKKSRRSPLTSQLLRGPGESLRRELENVDEKIDNFFFKIIMSAMFAILLLMILASSGNGKVFVWQLWLLAVCYGLIIILLSFELYRLLRNRQDLYLGLDCERAVGQELNQLMLDGCRVFHDFQADNFNIDHIVIGGNGVFAIETKGRSKPDRGRGQEDVRVTYDGHALLFPTWSEKDPIEQAKRQASWLSNWLTKAVGEQISVKPALALPGWYVDRRGKDLLIFSGKNPQFLSKITTETTLSPDMIQRVAFQIEQQCRDVEPQAYKKKKEFIK